MIHLITAQNRAFYSGELKALHAARRDCFILEKGWSLAEENGGEYDPYDDDLAAHLVGLSDDGRIAVSCRVRSAEAGGVIPDLYPHLLAPGEPPAGAPGDYECTRYFASPWARGERGAHIRASLHMALVEHAREQGATRLMGLTDARFFPYLQKTSGLRLRPLGPPMPDGDGETIGFEISVTREDVEETRRRLSLPDRQLYFACSPAVPPPAAMASPLAFSPVVEPPIAARPRTMVVG